jgi:hypothetical protein
VSDPVPAPPTARTPCVAAALALGVAWALHDAGHAIGLATGPSAAGWATRAGVLVAVAGGALAMRGRVGAACTALGAGAIGVLVGSAGEWLLGAPAPAVPLATAHAARAAGAGLAVVARIALPLAALGVVARYRRSGSFRNSPGFGPATAEPPVTRRSPPSTR